MAAQIVAKGSQEQVKTGAIHAVTHRAAIALSRGEIRHDQLLALQLSQPRHHRWIGRTDSRRDFSPRRALDLGQVTNDLLRGRQPESGQRSLLIGRETREVLEVSDHLPQSAVLHGAAGSGSRMPSRYLMFQA